MSSVNFSDVLSLRGNNQTSFFDFQLGGKIIVAEISLQAGIKYFMVSHSKIM